MYAKSRALSRWNIFTIRRVYFFFFREENFLVWGKISLRNEKHGEDSKVAIVERLLKYYYYSWFTVIRYSRWNWGKMRERFVWIFFRYNVNKVYDHGIFRYRLENFSSSRARKRKNSDIAIEGRSAGTWKTIVNREEFTPTISFSARMELGQSGSPSHDSTRELYCSRKFRNARSPPKEMKRNEQFPRERARVSCLNKK